MKRYKNIKSFQEKLQSGKAKTDDVLQIGELKFTMIDYDLDGRQIIYHTNGISEKYHYTGTGYTLEVNTSDRYSNGFVDVQLEIYQG